MEFQVLHAGMILFPCLSLNNESGLEIFCSSDADTEWHSRPRPCGWYREVAWIPAHLLRDGALTVTAALWSFQPRVAHFLERDAIGIRAVESASAGAARGELGGWLGGVIRPSLQWNVEYQPHCPSVSDVELQRTKE
jgi:hypothetical protein